MLIISQWVLGPFIFLFDESLNFVTFLLDLLLRFAVVILHECMQKSHAYCRNEQHTHTHTFTRIRPIALVSFRRVVTWICLFFLIPCIKTTEKQHKRVKHETISGKWKDPGGEALRESVLISTVGYDRLTCRSASSGSVWLQVSLERKKLICFSFFDFFF